MNRRFVAALITLALAPAVMACGAPDSTGGDAPSNAAIGSDETAAEWAEVVTIAGDSIKETESFTVANREWRVAWDTQPGEHGDGIFSFDIMTSDGDYVTTGANVMGASQDSTVQRGAGDYYLAINATQAYTITVEQR